MNLPDQKLDACLRAAKVPPRPAEYWASFPRRVSDRLTCPPAPDRVGTDRPGFMPRALGWAMAAVALVAGAFFLIKPMAQKSGHWDEEAAAKLFREVAPMFPGQLRAIVRDESGLRIVLAEAPDVPVSPPILVRLCGDDACRSIITFSGQEIPLGSDIMQVLSKAKGGVIVAGNRFAWSSDAPDAGAPFRIQTFALEKN